MSSPAAKASVSVVMIFRNAQTFMEEAIRSVLAQTHEDIELLLCDDGSTDSSTSLAQEWAKRHPAKVRYLEHPGHAHRGMSATRNLGIAAARGDLLAFLDADDVWEPDHLARFVKCLLGHPQASVVCGRALSWHSWGGSTREDAWSPLAWPSDTVVSPPDMLTAVLRQGSYSTPMCSLLVRRQVLLDVGGAESSFTSMFEDQVLLAKLYLTQLIVICDAPTALYRQHPGSSTVEAIRRGLYHESAPNQSRAAYLKWLREQPQLRGTNTDPQLASAFRAAVRRHTTVARFRRRTAAVLRRTLPRPLIRMLRRMPIVPSR